jgi:hypothetical protein
VSQGKDANHQNVAIKTNADSSTVYTIQNLDNRDDCAPNNNSLIWSNPYISNAGGMGT